MASVQTAELEVHPQSKEGFSVGKGELYDKFRPSYPSELLSFVRKAIGDKEKINVLEIASGTGISTRALLAHPEWKDSIVELRAVEPSEGMRQVFEKQVKDTRVSLSEGTFDHTGIPDAWADVIIIAQAFHWCLKYEETAVEFARVLKSGGVVALIWNREQPEDAEWMEEMRAIRDRYPSSMHEDYLKWMRLFDTKAYQENFDKAEETSFPNTLKGTVDSVAIAFTTYSIIARLPEDEKKKVEAESREILNRGNGIVWVDKEKGIFEIPNRTDLVLFRRK